MKKHALQIIGIVILLFLISIAVKILGSEPVFIALLALLISRMMANEIINGN